MTAQLYAQLAASQVATVETVDLDRAIEEAIINLRRIERGIVWGRNAPGEFTAKKIESIASRLLQAASAHRLGLSLRSAREAE